MEVDPVCTSCKLCDISKRVADLREEIEELYDCLTDLDMGVEAVREKDSAVRSPTGEEPSPATNIASTRKSGEANCVTGVPRTPLARQDKQF